MKVLKDCSLQRGSERVPLTAVAPVGAVSMRETIRLGPSACLKDVFGMSLCSHIIQCSFLRSSTPSSLRYFDFLHQTQDRECCDLYLCNLGFISLEDRRNVANEAALAGVAS